jgi:ParB/RepB/Spo0J family partition protein
MVARHEAPGRVAGLAGHQGGVGRPTMESRTFNIDQIYVPVKRRNMLDPGVANEIAESMLEEGQLTPILVRPDGERFVLVEGLHRLEACKALGEATIEAFIVQTRRH